MKLNHIAAQALQLRVAGMATLKKITKAAALPLVVAGILLSVGTSAFALTFTSATVPYGATGGVSGTVNGNAHTENGIYIGQIDLYQTGLGQVAQVFCLDLTNNLQGGTMSSSIVSNGPLSITPAGITLNTTQIQQIGALAFNGAAAISLAIGANNSVAADIASAATQLAIWDVEYGAGNSLATQWFSMTSASGVNGEGSILTSINSLVQTYISDVAIGTGAWVKGFTYALTLFTPTIPANSQDLGFSATQTAALATPIPASLSLFVGGLAVFGFLRRRKKKRSFGPLMA
jgi:hypothetical protein